MKTGGKNALVVLSYTLFSVVLFHHLWVSPSTRILTDNQQDQIFFEWVITHAARLFTDGDNPLFTDQLNAPLGVNLMANTSVLGFALPFAPITLLFGAPVTFALISTIGPAATAVAWYFMLTRTGIVRSSAAAYVGALFCGFAPPMISQTTGHPNIAAQFMIPLIAWAVFRLREPGSPVRKGLVLAAFVLYQCFINEEVLFLTAFAMLIFLLVYLPPRQYWPSLRAVLPAVGVTALVAGAILAYPLYHQFAGPQAYHGLPTYVHGYSADLGSFTEFSRRSVLGDVTRIEKMGGATEENTFFGWPLLLLLPAAALALWWHRGARALFVTGIVFAILSLGPVVKYKGEETEWKGPWRYFTELPLFDSVVPTRLSLVMVPLIGALLALLIDKFVMPPPAPATAAATTDSGDAGDADDADDADEARAFAAEALPDRPAGAETPAREPVAGEEREHPAGRWLWAAALAMALLPLIPTPQPADLRIPVPAFFTTGAYRQHIPDQATVVVIPNGWYEGLDAMRWSVRTRIDFKVVGGYFLGPDPNDPENRAMFGPVYPATAGLFSQVSTDGVVPQITVEQRAQADADVAYWKATRLVLHETHGNSDAIRQTADQLFGPGEKIVDVWLWKVGTDRP